MPITGLVKNSRNALYVSTQLVSRSSVGRRFDSGTYNCPCPSMVYFRTFVVFGLTQSPVQRRRGVKCGGVTIKVSQFAMFGR